MFTQKEQAELLQHVKDDAAAQLKVLCSIAKIIKDQKPEEILEDLPPLLAEAIELNFQLRTSAKESLEWMMVNSGKVDPNWLLDDYGEEDTKEATRVTCARVNKSH